MSDAQANILLHDVHLGLILVLILLAFIALVLVIRGATLVEALRQIGRAQKELYRLISESNESLKASVNHSGQRCVEASAELKGAIQSTTTAIMNASRR